MNEKQENNFFPKQLQVLPAVTIRKNNIKILMVPIIKRAYKSVKGQMSTSQKSPIQ